MNKKIVCNFKYEKTRQIDPAYKYTLSENATCKRRATFVVIIERKDGELETHKVCGVHKNCLQRRAVYLGLPFEILPLDTSLKSVRMK